MFQLEYQADFDRSNFPQKEKEYPKQKKWIIGCINLRESYFN